MKSCFDHLILHELLNTTTLKIHNMFIVIDELILFILDMLDIFNVLDLFF